ncbi:MAG: HypC/HybG/HupF family hydrogenase formation chaperone [Candidatus Margulisiibacteriota bacterium]
MCLAIPGKVESISGDSSEVNFSGLKRTVSLKLLPGVKTGDYVLVHAGFAIQTVDKHAAKKTLKLFKGL